MPRSPKRGHVVTRHLHRDLWVPLVTGLLAVSGGTLPGAAVTHGDWSLVLLAVGLLALTVAGYIGAALVWGWPLPGGFEPPPSPDRRPNAGWLADRIYGPEAQARRDREWERGLDARDAEEQRRQRVVNALYREYVGTHADSLDAAMRAGTADLPREWVEARLREMGEPSWRWERYRPDL